MPELPGRPAALEGRCGAAAAATVWTTPVLSDPTRGYYSIQIGPGDGYGACEPDRLPKALLFSLAVLHSHEYGHR